MSILLIDAETFSALDLNQVGSRVYAQHPSTEAMLWSVRDPDWPDSLVFEGDLWSVLDKLKATNRIKWTRNEELVLVHWSKFDRHIEEYSSRREWKDGDWDGDRETGWYCGPNNTKWVDLAQISLIHGGPVKLKWAAEFWAQEEIKFEGKHLISRFCSPQLDDLRITAADDPIRWEEFRAYARQDTNVMVPILNALDHIAETGQSEDIHDHWPYIRAVDRMNDRGAPIDRRSAQLASDILYDVGTGENRRVEDNYGVKLGNYKKVAEFLGLPNAQRETVEDILPSLTGERLDLAEAYLLVGGAASKKLVPMIRMSSDEHPRVHDAFVYHGAWTRRLTSMNPQLQNLVREPCREEFFEALADDQGYWGRIFDDVRSNIRGFIQAEPEMTLSVADYNAIECRYSAWLSGETWLIDVFRDGGDPYLIMASEIYGEQITDKSDPRRQFGKTVELGAQYGLGPDGLLSQCAKRGIIIERDFAVRVIDAYRSLHGNIVRSWKERESALWELVNGVEGQSIEIGKRGTTYTRTSLSIKVTRPSGFSMYLWLPEVRTGKWPDGSPKSEISFMGRGKGGMMVRQSTYGGRAFQGEVQGGSADYMLEGMLAAERAGFPPVMSVHDETATEIPDICIDAHVELEKLLCVDLEWAKGLPVKAEGYTGRRFTKI